MDAHNVRERVLTGGRGIKGLLIAAYVLVGLVLVDVVVGLDRSDIFWFDEGEQVLYCRVGNETDGHLPPTNILTGWLVLASSSLEATCRHHPLEHVDDEALAETHEASTRLGVTRLEIHHAPEVDAGCIDVRGGIAGRVRARACVEDAGP